uniref:transcriptional repressor NF-X1-like isoform X2 n=1 Tax=Myxine glutinosa TaxID=7769 RepID=UPI0035901B1C
MTSLNPDAATFTPASQRCSSGSWRERNAGVSCPPLTGQQTRSNGDTCNDPRPLKPTPVMEKQRDEAGRSWDGIGECASTRPEVRPRGANGTAWVGSGRTGRERRAEEVAGPARRGNRGGRHNYQQNRRYWSNYEGQEETSPASGATRRLDGRGYSRQQQRRRREGPRPGQGNGSTATVVEDAPAATRVDENRHRKVNDDNTEFSKGNLHNSKQNSSVGTSAPVDHSTVTHSHRETDLGEKEKEQRSLNTQARGGGSCRAQARRKWQERWDGRGQGSASSQWRAPGPQIGRPWRETEEGLHEQRSLDKQHPDGVGDLGKENTINRTKEGTPWQKNLQSKTGQAEVYKSLETHTGSLIQQLSAGTYECMVCCDVIQANAYVWSCQNCFHVFHLPCIRRWARSPAAKVEDEAQGWRCPGCQNVSDNVPGAYYCFCGKVRDPEWNRNEIPHSCGEVCGKKRRDIDCSHSCNILCHPGPCPSCPAFVKKACACGRSSQSMRCGQGNVIRCKEVCAKTLNCGQHLCSLVCHAGPCPRCEVKLQKVCHCGKQKVEVLCGEDMHPFCCQVTCDRLLECGHHRCATPCHPPPCSSCPRLPGEVLTCPCGRTPLEKLLDLGNAERSSCTDPLATCSAVCDMMLPCGLLDNPHTCKALCHEGPCPTCRGKSEISCHCGYKTREVRCAKIKLKGEPFLCDKRCNKKRKCGRHKCNQVCCVDEEHTCTATCGRVLTCKVHKCEELCHRSECPPCWQASFEELTCYCGDKVIFPPIPCGTKPPECNKPCTREHACEHPVYHTCHSDVCPPCTYLTQKWCMGQHELRQNIPCHLMDISCGLPCCKPLPCGLHTCQRQCHRGPCHVTGETPKCRQPCPLPRDACGHPCGAPCHAGGPCPRISCKTEVTVVCPCANRKEKLPCWQLSGTSYQRVATIALVSKMSEQPGESIELRKLVTGKEIQQSRLECTEECAILERNRRLVEALQIDPNVNPFNKAGYTDFLKEEARKDLKFIRGVEDEIRTLVENTNKGKMLRRSYNFPYMSREHRRIVHELAEAYGLESLSFDSEPKRSVTVTAIKGKSCCSTMSLTCLTERELTPKPPPPIPHRSNTALGAGEKAAEPVDYFDVQD